MNNITLSRIHASNYAPFWTKLCTNAAPSCTIMNFHAIFYIIPSISHHCEPSSSLVQNEHFPVFLMYSSAVEALASTKAGGSVWVLESWWTCRCEQKPLCPSHLQSISSSRRPSPYPSSYPLLWASFNLSTVFPYSWCPAISPSLKARAHNVGIYKANPEPWWTTFML